MQQTLKPTFPQQHQDRQPGLEKRMDPKPQYDDPNYKAAGKMNGMRAVVTGGDSGIGRSAALYFAKEGADVAVLYLNENQDAAQTQKDIEALGRKCLLFPVDLKSEDQARAAVERAVEQLGGIDVLVNNAGVQYPQNSIMDISREQLLNTFESNIFSYFYVTKAPGSIWGSAALVT